MNKITGLCLVMLFIAACTPPQILLSPVPSHIKSMEGYARIEITDEQQSQHSKFSFFFNPPAQGRINVSDFLGRTLYQIIITGEKAYLIIPAKKVYWKGNEEEIIDKFLGFHLTLSEMVCLFSGHWPASPADKNKISSWKLTKDQNGRIVSGQREDLSFKVEKFIKDTQIAHNLVFKNSLKQGRLKFIRIDFNSSRSKTTFLNTFLNKCERITWEEIQDMLN